jgi:hypothetical protein
MANVSKNAFDAFAVKFKKRLAQRVPTPSKPPTVKHSDSTLLDESLDSPNRTGNSSIMKGEDENFDYSLEDYDKFEKDAQDFFVSTEKTDTDWWKPNQEAKD